ncbi:MAG: hypothetical protein ABTQ26_11780 [Azonexus sp.]
MADFIDPYDTPGFVDPYDRKPGDLLRGDQSSAPVATERTQAGDLLLGLGRGVKRLPGALTGLVDIPAALLTGERPASQAADWLGEQTGFQPSKWADADAKKFSPGAIASLTKQNEAWSKSGADRLGNALLTNRDDLPAAWDQANLRDVGKAIVDAPGATAINVAESIPSIFAGGAVSKGVKAIASRISPVVAGAIGEGAVTAGQTMDQIDPSADPRQAAAASLGAGALTGLIGAAGGKLSQKMGLEDVQTLMAGGRSDAAGMGLVGRITGGAIAEGVFQELPQSMQEQIWQNWAENKDLGDGVIRQGVEGLIAGMALGGGSNVLSPKGSPAPEPGVLPAESDVANAELGQRVDQYSNLPGDQKLLTAQPSVIEVPTADGGTSTVDRNDGVLSAAVVDTQPSRAEQGSLLRSYTAEEAKSVLTNRPDAERMQIVPHPVTGDRGRVTIVPKPARELEAIDAKAAATTANEARTSQVAAEEESQKNLAASQKKIAELHRAAAGVEKSINGNTSPEDAAIAREHAADLRLQASTLQNELVAPDKDPVALAKDWDASNKPDAWAKAATESEPAFAAIAAESEAIPTIGLNKEDSLSEAIGSLNHVVTGKMAGVKTESLAQSTNRDGPFVVTFREGLTGQPTAADITGILVNPAHPELVAPLQKQFPGLAVREYGAVAEVVAASRQDASQQELAPSAVQPLSQMPAQQQLTKDRLQVARQEFLNRTQTLAQEEKGQPITPKAKTKPPAKPVTTTPEDTAQDEIQQSTGAKFAQKRGETRDAYERRMAAEKNARKFGRRETPAEQDHVATVREAIGDPQAAVSVAPVISLPDADKVNPGQLSRQAAGFMSHVAKMFGKSVVVIDNMPKADGFYLRGNTIYVSSQSTTAHLAVLGHEMMHALKNQSPKSYQAMLDAVGDILTPAQLRAQVRDYFGDKKAWTDQQVDAWLAKAENKEMITEEWMADLSGNRFTESSFWESVFDKIDAQHGSATAKGIIAKLRLALVNALQKLMSLAKGNKFAVDNRVRDQLDEIREAMAMGFAAYAKAVKDGQVFEGNQPAAKFARGTANQTLPTRWPTSKVVKPSVNDDMVTDLATLKQNQEQYAKAVAAIIEEPGMHSADVVAGSLDEQAEHVITRMQSNLTWLYDQVPEAVRERSKLWYDGARKIADQWAEKYDITQSQAAGALAVLSPQKDWFMNVTMAERVLDIAHTKMDHVFDSRMGAAAFSFLTKDAVKESEDSQKNLKAYAAVKGKTLRAVAINGDLRQLSVWIRAYDEAYHDPKHAIVTPEGGFVEDKTTVKGDPTMRAWGDFTTPGKAASIYLDGSAENINKQLGGEHKVRNFYNNIFAPKDSRFTTIDTHAVAADLLRPLAGADKPVSDNFGKTGGTNLTGLSGTYALHYEAYRRAAESRGILPREMQSITWEAVRGLFTEGFKGKKNNLTAVDNVWREVDAGSTDVASARARIVEMAGGIEHPDWWNEGNAEYREVLRESTYVKERSNFQGAKVTFEVAPDPRNAELKSLWDALPPSSKLAISDKVAWKIAAKALGSFNDDNMKGELHHQTGGWMADTNPSMSIWFNKRASGTKINQFARMLGFALQQESMMRTSPKAFVGMSGEKVKPAGAIEINRNPGDDVGAIYAKARSVLDGKGNPYVFGHTTTDNSMVIIHTDEGSISTDDLASKIADALGEDYTVSAANIYVEFLDKGRNSYALRGKTAIASESSLRARSDQLRAEAGVLFDQLVREAKLSTKRPDVASDERAGGRASRDGEEVRSYGKSSPGSVQATGTHFSGAERSTLDGRYYGTGASGKEAERVRAATDPRIKERVYFYVDAGRGITPEQGVGSVPHSVKLNNLYDANADTWLQMKVGRALKGDDWSNAFESAIIDAGFDGFINDFGTQRAAVLLGRHNVPVTAGKSNAVSQPKPRATNAAADAVEQSRVLPGGMMSGADWKKMVPLVVKDADVSGLQDTKDYYKSDVVAALRGGAKFSPSRAQTETPEFKKWFGDSKVVDADGKPLVVYHGTNKDFDTFRTGLGAHFGTVDQAADILSFVEKTQGSEGSNVMPVYLSIKNPKRTRDMGNSPISWAKQVAKWQEQGFDGLVYRNTKEGSGGDSYVAFDRKQIKSATGNNGQFDGSNPNITYSLKRQIEADAFAAVQDNASALIAEYFKRFGNVIDPDNVKMLFPAYAKDPSLAAAVHEPSSALAKLIYAEALKRNAGNPVIFTAGGGGSGKSEAMPMAMKVIGTGNDSLIYDSTLSSLKSAVARIDQALASGSTVSVVYTNRPVKAAFQFAMGHSRVVPIKVLAEAHVGASNTLRALSLRYAKDDRVLIAVVNNLGEMDNMALGSVADVFSYTYNKVERDLHDLAKQALAAGAISPERYAALNTELEGAGQPTVGSRTEEVQGRQQGQDLGSDRGRKGSSARFQPTGHQGYLRDIKAAIAGLTSPFKVTRDKAGASYFKVMDVPPVIRNVIAKDGSKPFKRLDQGLWGSGSSIASKAANTHAVAEHGAAVDPQVVINLPQLLADPVAVFSGEGGTNANSYRVVVHGAIIAIEPKGLRGFVLTIYPSEKSNVAQWMKAGLLHYIDEKAASEAAFKEVLSMDQSQQFTSTDIPTTAAQARNGQFATLEEAVNASIAKGRQVVTKSNIESYPEAALSLKRAVASTIEKVDAAVDGLSNLPNQFDYLKDRYLTLGKIARVDEITKEVREAFDKAAPADKQSVYDYLTTRGATTGRISDYKLRSIAKRIKDTINYTGDQLVARGLLDQQARDHYQDQYLPRMYLRHMLDDDATKVIGMGKKPSDLGYLKHRKDIPAEIRELVLGEIKDPAFLSVNAIGRAMRDVSLMDWMGKISQNNDWVFPEVFTQWKGKKVTAYWLRAEADRIERQAEHYEPAAQAKAVAMVAQMRTEANTTLGKMSSVDHKKFKQIPDTMRYGLLRGMWVRNEIYNDIMGASQIVNADPTWFEDWFGFGGKGTKLTQWWKFSKVALNPPGQIRNFMSNMVMLQLSGIGLHRLPFALVEAGRDIANNGPYWKVAKKYGVTESTFTAQELFRVKRDLVELEAGHGKLSSLRWLMSAGSRFLEKVSDLYQFTEALGKTIKIMEEMKAGKSEAEAAIEAQKWLFDYSLVPQSVRLARNAPIGMPFITYQIKVLPRLLEVAAKYPWRFLPWAGLLYGMQAAVAAMFGVDDDELKKLKKSLPQWLQDRGHTVFLPIRDADGRLQVADVGYFFPWSFFSQAGKHLAEGNLKKALVDDIGGQFSAPIIGAGAALMTNYDTFTKQPIYRESDPTSYQAAAIANYAYDLMAPPFISSHGFASPMGLLDKRFGGKMTQAVANTTNRFGDPKATEEQAIAGLLGLNFYGMDPDHTRITNIKTMQFKITEAEKSLRYRLMDKGLSPEERAAYVKDYQSRMMDLNKELHDYLQESAVPEQLKVRKKA